MQDDVWGSPHDGDDIQDTVRADASTPERSRPPSDAIRRGPRARGCLDFGSSALALIFGVFIFYRGVSGESWFGMILGGALILRGVQWIFRERKLRRGLAG